jgi:hypothetical protein
MAPAMQSGDKSWTDPGPVNSRPSLPFDGDAGENLPS